MVKTIMNDLVSIVIPVYNAEKYLEKAIDSCLNQTYSNKEIITVNDGSTDNTSEVLSSYSDKISVINQKNTGIAGALNTGIRAMKGNWYKLMNADDILYPDCVEILVSELEKIDDKKTIVHGNFDLIDSAGRKIKEIKRINHNDWSQFDQSVALLDHQYINWITAICPKSIFDKYGYYNESVRFSEDVELLLRLFLLHGFRFHLIEKQLAMYRVHPDQDTRSLRDEGQDYGKTLRKSILAKLNPELRLKYENALKDYQKQNKKNIPISWRVKRKMKKAMYRSLPNSTAKKILTKYRDAKYSNNKE